MASPQQARTIHVVSRNTGSPELSWERTSTEVEVAGDASQPVSLVVGDAQDDVADGDVYLGHAAKVNRRADGTISVRTSITGFPPIYCYDGPGPLVVSSSILRIAQTPGVTLRFAQRGIAEWIRIGKPVQHRTIFEHVHVLAAGVTFEVTRDRGLLKTHEWAPANTIHFRSYDEYLEAQVDAFRSAVRRTDTSHSFLSLTAGLDTRAVLATLTQEGRKLDAVTLSGRADSLDARHARALCSALGMRHTVVRQDDEFFSAIEPRTREAVQLSGGIVGLEGALEVNMYRKLGSAPPARVSGNLGNQVGRSGTEGVGIRNLASTWFSGGIQAAVKALPQEHWHQQIAQSPEGLSAGDLIHRESLFASLGNATIGSAMSIQQTPYADRQVLENKYAEPPIVDHDTGSARSIRMRDIRHRLFGEPVTRSFQRRIVAAAKGPVAHIPINWGWRPEGGMSVPGMILGAGAGLDAFLTQRKGIKKALQPVAQLLGVRGLNGFGSDPLWRDRRAQEFLRDTLQQAVNENNALFAPANVRQLLVKGAMPDEVASVAAQLCTLALAAREYGVAGGIEQ